MTGIRGSGNIFIVDQLIIQKKRKWDRDIRFFITVKYNYIILLNKFNAHKKTKNNR